MNPNQIPYDQLDWLQIGAYFVALPIVAIIGALLGLFGCWRRGGVLWATNVGMLGGAVTCLTCGLAIWTLDQKLSSDFIDYFTDEYRWWMLTATLGATCACALAAGLAWRLLHKAEAERPFAFSLKQFFLLQFFALLGLGCWISLRLFVLEASDPKLFARKELAKSQARWEAAGWVVNANTQSVSINLSGLDAATVAAAFAIFSENDRPNRLPFGLVGIQFTDGAGIDLKPILESPRVRLLSLEFLRPSDNMMEQLGKSKIEELSLILNGGLKKINLAPLAKSNSLRHLFICGEISSASVESLVDNDSIRDLMLYESGLFGSGNAPRRWPRSMENLLISQAILDDKEPIDLTSLASHPKLKKFHMAAQLLRDDNLAILQTLPALESTHIAIGPLSERGYASLANLHANSMDSGSITLRVDDPEFTQADAALLKQTKNLRSLQLYFAGHGDDIFEELSQMPRLQDLEITSPCVTHAGLMKLAILPELKWLRYPEHLTNKEFEAEFEAKRELNKLPRLGMFSTLKPMQKPKSKAAGNAP